MRMYNYATVCSGVEGCTLALNAGAPTRGRWNPVFFSEVAPFPSAILNHYYPTVPNLGDMSNIHFDKDRHEISYQKNIGTTKKPSYEPRVLQFHGRLDLLAGGTPCQDFSIAGQRKGGAKDSGTRSSLCWEYLRLVSELSPRMLLWENVVGCFSTNQGRDFSGFIAALDALGYDVSWRVLDCQFTRVDKWPLAIPQRRRRVWLVGSSRTNNKDSSEILFEPRGLWGNTAPRRTTRKEIAGAVEDGAIGADGCDYITHDRTRISDFNVARPLYATDYKDGQTICPVDSGNYKCYNFELTSNDALISAQRAKDNLVYRDDNEACLYENHPQDSRVEGPLSTASTISRKAGTGGGNVDIVCYQQGCDVYNGAITGDVAPTVTSRSGVPADTGPKAMLEKVISTINGTVIGRSPKNGGNSSGCNGNPDVMLTLTATDRHGVAVASAKCHNASVSVSRRVRRLIPLECERLMGYPCNYTKIPYRNKPADKCPDGPRYEACGNGWAINCARWVLLGIHRYLEGLE